MSCLTFFGVRGCDNFAKQAGKDSLDLLERVCSYEQTSQIGPGFIRNYAYSKHVAGADRVDTVERWMGSPSDIELVCSIA